MRTELPGPKRAATSAREELAAAVPRALRMRRSGAFPHGQRGLVVLFGLSGLFAAPPCAGRRGYGEAERVDASVSLQGALQGPDGGEPVGRPGWGDRRAGRVAGACLA